MRPISLIDAGRVLATDAPAELVTSRHARTLEEAFISYLEEVNGAGTPDSYPALRRRTSPRSDAGR